jgi:C4-dicarboxylate-specific signal transduction histidine kinase
VFEALRVGVRIEFDLPPMPPTLMADPILIEQVLLNLAKNGIDAMRNATAPVLRVSVRMLGGAIDFAVADVGPGLTPEARAKLFEPFFTTKAEGMGMGLNICRSIIESHQGRLWAETNEWGGCTFRFTLPLGTAGASTRVARAA